VRIVLKKEKRLHVLENPIPNTLVKDAEEEVRNEHQRYVDDDEQAASLMLASLSPKLQRQHENMNAHTMICVSKNYLMRLVGKISMRPLRSYSTAR